MNVGRELPPISGKLAGVKARKTYGDRTLFTVEPVARAGSVPLRNGPTATTHRQKQVERYFSTAAQDPNMRGIAGWAKTLEDEKKSFPSTSMWCELMLNKVIKETQHMAAPNTLRTAVCCMLLHRLCPMLGHCEQLMSSLLFEVFSAIYVDWPEYMAQKFVNFSHEANDDDEGRPAGSTPPAPQPQSGSGGGAGGGSRSMTLKNEYDADAMGTPQNGKYLVAALHQRTTYFLAHETLQKARMHVLGAPSRCIARCINTWIKSLLYIIFNVWRSEARTAVQRYKKATGIVERIYITKSRNRLKIHFAAWRKITKDRQNMFEQEHIQQKLLQRMGRRIKELEEENAGLSEQFATLLAEHRHVGKRLHEMSGLLVNFRRPLGEMLKAKDSSVGKETSGSGDGAVAQDPTVSFIDAADPEDAFKQQVYRENDSALMPKPKHRRRRSSSSLSESASFVDATGKEVPAPEAVTLTAEATAALDEVTHRPNRVQQLSDYLELDPKTTDVARPSEFFPKVVEVKEVKHVVLPNYTDVLDWISLRTQLMNVTAPAFSKRVSNFTTDFKDGLRLACLLVTIGAEKAFLDEVTEMPQMARSGLVLRAAMSFLVPDDNFYLEASDLLPVDLIRGKGNKISRLFFALYDKFNKVPLEVTASHLDPEVMEQLVGNGFMKAATMQTLMSTSLLAQKLMSSASLEMSARSPNSRSQRMEDPDPDLSTSVRAGDFINDAQLLHWFRDLAASDSDEDVDNFDTMQASVLDASSVCGSVAKSMSRRISRSSLSFVRKDSQVSPERMSSWSTNRAKAKRRQANGALVAQWVQAKMLTTHPELQTAGREVHPLDALEAVLEGMYPKLMFGGSDTKTRIKRMEAALHSKLHLIHVRLDAGHGGATSAANADASAQKLGMPVRQLLMFLYLVDQGAVMSQ